MAKPHVNVGTLGQIDHGKTTLTEAIRRQQARRFPEADHDRYKRNASFRPWDPACEYETDARRYSHYDPPSHADCVQHLITGCMPLDGAILVVSAEDGLMEQAREQVGLLYRLGLPAPVVFLSKKDRVADADWIDMVEVEARQLLNEVGYPGDEVPVVRGDALAAVRCEGKDDPACACIEELLGLLDSQIPTPPRAEDGPFLMSIEDVFSIKGRGIVATGSIWRGKVKVGDEAEIIGLMKAPKKTTVTGVEMLQKTLEYGMAGDSVGVLLRGIERTEIERGQVLAKPGSVRAYTRFQAEVYIYMMSHEEGGRSTPFASGCRLRLYLRTTDVLGEITLSEGAECAPGAHASVTVELPADAPIAMEPGLRFGIRDGGRAVGAGVVTRVLA